MCVRTHEKPQSDTLVYQDLLATYDDTLSASLTATTLRQELTMLKLDDKWRSGYEHFLHQSP